MAVLLTATVPAQTTPARDTVVLTDGRELQGRVLRVDADTLLLRTGSTDRTLARADVRSYRSVAERHRALLAAFRATAADDPAALLALAEQAERDDLPHEARLFRWYAVLQRPDDAAIHAALGNRERSGRFHVELDGKQVPFAEADARGEDFDDAWRLRSEHFAVRSAAGLRAGLDTLLALEAFYHEFHARFGDALSLLELVEPIDVRLYRSREQMPNLSNTVGAYFDPDLPALFTFWQNGRAAALFHEGTHALLHWFFERAARARGALPAWLDEGWAEYMDGLADTRVPHKPVFRDRSVQAAHLQTLAAAAQYDDLYGLHRVLNFKESDFGASTLQHVKYAQAWALFRHLWEHPETAARATFVDYLRAAAAGKGQASTFRRMFDDRRERLEQEAFR